MPRGDGPRGRPLKTLDTFASNLVRHLQAAIAQQHQHCWPDTRWKYDPVGFARTILGIEPWSRQAELLESIVHHSKVTCASGRGCGKSTSAAILALHRYYTWEDGQALLVAPSADQLDSILWAEIRRLHSDSGICVDCRKADPDQPRPCPHSAVLDGEPMTTSRGGLRPRDPRSRRKIKGRTSRKAAGMQGWGGPGLLIIVDEASGVADEIQEANRGTLLRGGDELAIGNYNYLVGWFHETFQGTVWHQIHIDSRENPNYVTGTIVHPGLATREAIDADIAQYGEESNYCQVHIFGKAPKVQTGKPFTEERISEIMARYAVTPEHGRLHIAIDPAGSGYEDRGDFTCIIMRRGYKIILPTPEYKWRGIDDMQILVKLLELIKRHGKPGEVPVVNIDVEGGIGTNLGRTLDAHREKRPNDFELWRLRGSKPAKRETSNYDRQRDLMYAVFERWCKEGGALPDIKELREEMAMISWYTNSAGKSKVTDKPTIRRELHRSPDLLDSCVMSCWQAPNTRFDDGAVNTAAEDSPPRPHTQENHRPLVGGNPYRSAYGNPFGNRRR
jgi:phage terminase large subunit